MIEVLPENVISQIAAGEVVERPAQMVKELVENSLDAGATEIEVEYSQGGRWLRIKDNGQGIRKEELALAVARHATSKIHLATDLFNLHTFGFRDEALAAIASVSRFQITSKPAEQNEGYRLNMEFGKLRGPDCVGADFGTQIEIQDLFENIPARLKFLKTEAGESSQIKNVLRALAMAHPQVQFKIKNEGKLIAFWPRTKTLVSRVQSILDESDLYEGNLTVGGIQIRAVVSSPQNVQKNSRQIWLFAQHRWIQDKSLRVAVMDAYRNLLMHGEYPIAAVFIDLPADEIDVNIHPAKSQVRFQSPAQVFRAVSSAIRSILQPAPWLPATEDRGVVEGEQRGLKTDNHSGFPVSPIVNLQFENQDMHRTQLREKKFDLASETGGGVASSSVLREPNVSWRMPKLERKVWSNLAVLGQAHLTYILAQSESSLFLIDQHAAHERIAFEKLMANFQGQAMDIQNFLLPITLHLEKTQIESLLMLATDLKRLGIEIESMGPDTVAITSSPSMLKDGDLVEALTQLSVEQFEFSGSYAVEKKIGDICATLACHSVVRAGQTLSLEQMKALLEEMDQFSFSSFCPHGRPVSIEIPFSKIEKDFGRTL